ncbi:dehydrogenase/reductase sdr family member [Plakobranchus ocellatus]|uniref:Dehydrogenase/reductase sdr family member n=1 Tax=Plakobranchus ocellatus TaxID=259542 RepID=A0AAV4B361_9GAST|nr:dehydrogenase/reductase sdr family member [Plakobranchus ocellatus]
MLCLVWSLFQAAAVIATLLVLALLVLILRSDADHLTVFWDRFGAKAESLAGKVVWITGASAGIGEHLAYQLTQVGCKVILSARREEQLNRVKDACLASAKCRTKADDILVLPLDVSQCDTHEDAVQTVLDKFDHIDILLNNAGRGMRGKWWEVDLKVDRELWELNILGPVSLTNCVLPHMMTRRQGHIVAVSSLLGLFPAARNRAYTGSKHAMQGYFGVLRNEMFEYNIDVTTICPGPIHSEFSTVQLTSSGKPLGRTTDFKRMSTERCAYLSCVAIANRMFESWISENPALLLMYFYQWFPTQFKWILGPRIVKAMVKGEGSDY